MQKAASRSSSAPLCVQNFASALGLSIWAQGFVYSGHAASPPGVRSASLGWSTTRPATVGIGPSGLSVRVYCVLVSS